MLEALFADESMLDMLFAFVKPGGAAGLSPPGHAAYFGKVVSVLIRRNFEDLVAYLRKKPGTMLDMLRCVHLYTVMELIGLVGWGTPPAIGAEYDTKWLLDCSLVPAMLEVLEGKRAENTNARAAQDNAAHLLRTLILHFEPNESTEILVQLESKAMVRRVAAAAFPAERGGDLVEARAAAATRVFSALLERAARRENKADVSDEKLPSAVSAAIETLVPRAVVWLGDAKGAAPIKLQDGTVLSPPLGTARLTVVRCVAALAQASYAQGQKAIADARGLVERLLDLFFAYPSNNLLHNLIRNVIAPAIDAPGPLRDSVLLRARLPDRIVSGFARNAERKSKQIKATEPTSADKSGAGASGGGRLRSFRLGFIAHLIPIASEIVKLGLNEDKIQSALASVKGWSALVSGTLAEENRLQVSVLGGRRPKNGSDDLDSDGICDEDTMGMVGSSGESGDPFSNDGNAGLAASNFDDNEWGNDMNTSSEATFMQKADERTDDSWDNEDGVFGDGDTGGAGPSGGEGGGNGVGTDDFGDFEDNDQFDFDTAQDGKSAAAAAAAGQAQVPGNAANAGFFDDEFEQAFANDAASGTADNKSGSSS